MNLRGKGTVSMSKTPLEWANLRSAGQIPCPVCYMREGGINGGKESGWEGKRLHGSVIREEAVGTGPVFFPALTAQHIPLHLIPFHRMETSPLHLEELVV